MKKKDTLVHNQFWLFIIIIVGIGSLILMIAHLWYQRSNPPFVPHAQETMAHRVFDQPHERFNLDHCTVDYIRNASTFNVNFPVIRISSSKHHNAWLHIIHTDAPEYPGYFIDTLPALFPFYTMEQDFQDAPHWGSSLLYKPLTYWIGHAYAVTVNHDTHTIQYSGGIGWGFTFSWWRFGPQAIMPYALSYDQWYKDWQMINHLTTPYTIIE